MLSNMIEQGLLEVKIAPGTSNKQYKRYLITEKGVDVLDYFEKADEILPKDVYSVHAVPS